MADEIKDTDEELEDAAQFKAYDLHSIELAKRVGEDASVNLGWGVGESGDGGLSICTKIYANPEITHFQTDHDEDGDITDISEDND